MSVQTPGGGGCAPVWQRSPALLAADAAAGKISVERARQVFPWMALFPCLAISSLVLGLHLLADGLRAIERGG